MAMRRLGLLVGALLVAAAWPDFTCADPALSPSQAKALQQRDYQADKEIVFGSVVDSLQDLGFTIDSADIQSGFIKAESATVNKTGFLDLLSSAESSGNTQATAFIETIRPGATRVRLTFVGIKTTSGTYGQGAREDHPIFDPQVYQRAFSRLDAAITERTGGPATAGGDITPIGALGPSKSEPIAKSKVELLAAARRDLEGEGFQILKDDEATGSLVTGPRGAPLTVAQADCGKAFGFSYLSDKRASTDIQYFVDASDGQLSVRTAIDGLYRTGYGNPDKNLTCTSRGEVENAFLAKVSAQLAAAAK